MLALSCKCVHGKRWECNVYAVFFPTEITAVCVSGSEIVTSFSEGEGAWGVIVLRDRNSVAGVREVRVWVAKNDFFH